MENQAVQGSGERAGDEEGDQEGKGALGWAASSRESRQPMERGTGLETFTTFQTAYCTKTDVPAIVTMVEAWGIRVATIGLAFLK